MDRNFYKHLNLFCFIAIAACGRAEQKPQEQQANLAEQPEAEPKAGKEQGDADSKHTSKAAVDAPIDAGDSEDSEKRNVAQLGGTSIGNGGDGVECPGIGSKASTLQVLDYYEAKGRWGFDIDLGKAPGYLGKVQLVLDRVKEYDGNMSNRLQEWFAEFGNEANFWDEVSLSEIEDADPVGVKLDCHLVQIAVQNSQNRMPHDKYYVFSQSYFKRLDDDNKAGIILHELFYRYLLSIEMKDSTRARYLNAFFSSRASSPTNEQVQEYFELLHDIKIPIGIRSYSMDPETRKFPLIRQWAAAFYLDAVELFTDHFVGTLAKDMFPDGENGQSLLFERGNHIKIEILPESEVRFVKKTKNFAKNGTWIKELRKVRFSWTQNAYVAGKAAAIEGKGLVQLDQWGDPSRFAGVATITGIFAGAEAVRGNFQLQFADNGVLVRLCASGNENTAESVKVGSHTVDVGSSPCLGFDAKLRVRSIERSPYFTPEEIVGLGGQADFAGLGNRLYFDEQGAVLDSLFEPNSMFDVKNFVPEKNNDFLYFYSKDLDRSVFRGVTVFNLNGKMKGWPLFKVNFKQPRHLLTPMPLHRTSLLPLPKNERLAACYDLGGSSHESFYCQPAKDLRVDGSWLHPNIVGWKKRELLLHFANPVPNLNISLTLVQGNFESGFFEKLNFADVNRNFEFTLQDTGFRSIQFLLSRKLEETRDMRLEYIDFSSPESEAAGFMNFIRLRMEKSDRGFYNPATKWQTWEIPLSAVKDGVLDLEPYYSQLLESMPSTTP